MGNQQGIPEEELFHPLGDDERRSQVQPVVVVEAEDSSECSFSSSSLPTLSASIMDDSVAEEDADADAVGEQDGGYNFYYDEEHEDTVNTTADNDDDSNVSQPLQEPIDEPMSCYAGVLWKKNQGRKRSRTHGSLFSSCTSADDDDDDDDDNDDNDQDDDQDSGCLLSADSLARSTSGLSFLARKSSAWSTTTHTNDHTTHNADHELDDDDDDDDSADYNTTTCTGLLPLHQYGQWSFSSQEESSGFMRRRASSELAYYSEEELTLPDGDRATSETDLRRSGRSYVVVTTACLPWMTGTAVNPLLRAAHLQRLATSTTVTLVIPWLEQPDERRTLYGPQFDYFHQPSDQEEYIREWLRDKAQMPDEAKSLQLLFYPASYHSGLNSIFATGDILCLIDPHQEVAYDVCILEEPEHLNWFSASAWTQKFQHVVGIVHTNYKAYASSHPGGLLTSPMIGVASSLMVRAYCHKVIKLSAVLQSYAPEKEVVSNVHGIRSEFLTEGQRRATSLLQQKSSSPSSSSGRAYFVGKLLWAKGLDRLLDLQDVYKKMTGQFFEIDIYGSGPEEAEIQRAFHGRGDKSRLSPSSSSSSDNVEEEDGERTRTRMAKTEYYYLPKSRHELFRRNPVPARFLGRKDHALLTNDYKVFVNPSVTEVLCTTTAEAIAMGKFAIIPRHRSNEFFEPFPNCLLYSTKEEFVAFVTHALSHEPTPLAPELAHQLTWEAATERCITAAAISKRDATRRDRVGKPRFEEQIAQIHSSLLSKGDDVIRKVMLGGSSSHDPTNPTNQSSTTTSGPIRVTC
eukprot:scaffold9821_cov47-Attheya_sp.AAC.8